MPLRFQHSCISPPAFIPPFDNLWMYKCKGVLYLYLFPNLLNIIAVFLY